MPVFIRIALILIKTIYKLFSLLELWCFMYIGKRSIHNKYSFESMCAAFRWRGVVRFMTTVNASSVAILNVAPP